MKVMLTYIYTYYSYISAKAFAIYEFHALLKELFFVPQIGNGFETRAR